MSILGIIIQAYASILGIIGMYIVFLKQRRNDHLQVLSARFRMRAASLTDFINREIAPAYPDRAMMKASASGGESFDDIIETIEHYRLERQKQIPSLNSKNLKALVTLWAMVQRDKDELVALKNEFSGLSAKPVMSRGSFTLFVGFFASELFLSFVAVYLVFVSHNLQYSITQLAIILAITGLVPLTSLLYRLL